MRKLELVNLDEFEGAYKGMQFQASDSWVIVTIVNRGAGLGVEVNGEKMSFVEAWRQFGPFYRC